MASNAIRRYWYKYVLTYVMLNYQKEHSLMRVIENDAL